MTRGRHSKFTNADIAQAMELKTWGASWRNIARGIGAGIHAAVRDARRRGMHRH